MNRSDPRPRLGALLFETTSACNLACPHCYNIWKGTHGRPPGELSSDEAMALLGKALDESVCTQVAFTGGEPTLREDLESLISLAKGKGAHTVLITNGTRLPESRILSLLNAGLDLFELPLHGPAPEVHDLALDAPGSFQRTTRAAVDISRNRGGLAFVFVGTRRNIHHWEGALELGFALGARTFLFNRYNAGGAGAKNPHDLMPNLAQVRRALEIAEVFSVRYEAKISLGVPIPPCLIAPTDFPHLGLGFCAAGTERAYVALGPSGQVRPCNHSGTVLGNLRERSLGELLASPAMERFKDAHPPSCSECEWVKECQGGCKAAAEACSGDLCGCDPFLAASQA